MSGPKEEKAFKEYLDKIDKLIFDDRSDLKNQLKNENNKNQIDQLTNSLNEVVNNIDITIKNQAEKLSNDIAEPIAIEGENQQVNYSDLISSFNNFSSELVENGYDYIQDNYEFINWFQKNKVLISQKIDAPIEPVRPQEPEKDDPDYDKKYEEYQKSLDEYWTKHQEYEKASVPSNFVNYVKERISYISKYGIIENEYIKKSSKKLEVLYDEQIKDKVSGLSSNPSDDELGKVLNEDEIQLYKSYKLQSLREKSIDTFTINGPETFNQSLNNFYDRTEKVDSEQLEYDVKVQNLQEMDQKDENVIEEMNKVTIEKAQKICQEMTNKQDFILNNKMKKGSIMIDDISGEDMSFFLRDYEKIMSDSNSNEITTTQKNLNFIEWFNKNKDIIAYHDLKIREGHPFGADFAGDKEPESYSSIVDHNSVNSTAKEFIEYARLKMAYISEYGVAENEYSNLSNDELNYLVKDGDEHAQMLSDLRKAESKAIEEHKVFEKNKELNDSLLLTAKSMKKEEDKKAAAIKPDDTIANVIENRKKELEKIQNKLLDTDPWFVINSKKFRTLKAELKSTIQMMNDYRTNPSPKAIQDISNKLNSLSDLATVYNQIKVTDAQKSGKSRDINRRDISKELSDFALKSKNDVNKKASYIYEEGLKNSLKSLKADNLECQKSKNNVDLIKNMDKLGKLYDNIEHFDFASKYKTEIGSILSENLKYIKNINRQRKDGFERLLSIQDKKITSLGKQGETFVIANRERLSIQSKGIIPKDYAPRHWLSENELTLDENQQKELINKKIESTVKEFQDLQNEHKEAQDFKKNLINNFKPNIVDDILKENSRAFKNKISDIVQKEKDNIIVLRQQENPDLSNNMLK